MYFLWLFIILIANTMRSRHRTLLLDEERRESEGSRESSVSQESQAKIDRIASGVEGVKVQLHKEIQIDELIEMV